MPTDKKQSSGRKSHRKQAGDADQKSGKSGPGDTSDGAIIIAFSQADGGAGTSKSKGSAIDNKASCHVVKKPGRQQVHPWDLEPAILWKIRSRVPNRGIWY